MAGKGCQNRIVYVTDSGMVDETPQVFFHKSKKNQFEFEVLTLNHLFSKNDQLAHPLDHPHRVDGSMCDESGSCIQICSNEAIKLSRPSDF